jgi:predicted nuclease with TOPRIM domain
MNKQQIAETLRQEVGELEVSIKKVQARCERLKKFVLNLEEEINPTQPPQKSILDGKFREVVDRVFGEKPKQPKR